MVPSFSTRLKEKKSKTILLNLPEKERLGHIRLKVGKRHQLDYQNLLMSKEKLGSFSPRSTLCSPFISVSENGINGVDYYIFSRILPAYNKNSINWRNLWKN